MGIQIVRKACKGKADCFTALVFNNSNRVVNNKLGVNPAVFKPKAAAPGSETAPWGTRANQEIGVPGSAVPGFLVATHSRTRFVTWYVPAVK